jgi:hypothetical protein
MTAFVRRLQQQKTSRFLGVTLSGSNGDVRWWTAQIHKHRHKIRVGYSYATEEAAARAYDRASIAINGRSDGMNTNFPLDRYPEQVRKNGQHQDQSQVQVGVELSHQGKVRSGGSFWLTSSTCVAHAGDVLSSLCAVRSRFRRLQPLLTVQSQHILHRHE